MIASDRSGAGLSVETARTKPVVSAKTVSWGFEVGITRCFSVVGLLASGSRLGSVFGFAMNTVSFIPI